MAAMSKPVVTIDYTNWRKVRSLRRVKPTGRMIFESNEYHREPQWFVEAWDVDKEELRLFAVVDIHSWGQSE
jgi:predicted DNA-binding transcriptional regulator YafY